MVGWSMALAVLLIAHPKPPAGNEDIGTAVVELTYASPVKTGTHRAVTPTTTHPKRVVAPLVVLNVTDHTRSNPSYVVTMQDIARWEDVHGHVPVNAVVMARSDSPTAWRRTGNTNNAERFPGFSEDAIRFLVEARYAYGLGTDTAAAGHSVVLVYRGKRQPNPAY